MFQAVFKEFLIKDSYDVSRISQGFLKMFQGVLEEVLRCFKDFEARISQGFLKDFLRCFKEFSRMS